MVLFEFKRTTNMDAKTKQEKEAKLREEYPHMFDHPQAEEGEIYLTDSVVDASSVQVALYKNAGLKSTRLGEVFLRKIKGKKDEVQFYPIFANLDEFIRVAED